MEPTLPKRLGEVPLELVLAVSDDDFRGRGIELGERSLAVPANEHVVHYAPDRTARFDVDEPLGRVETAGAKVVDHVPRLGTAPEDYAAKRHVNRRYCANARCSGGRLPRA